MRAWLQKKVKPTYRRCINCIDAVLEGELYDLRRYIRGQVLLWAVLCALQTTIARPKVSVSTAEESYGKARGRDRGGPEETHKDTSSQDDGRDRQSFIAVAINARIRTGSAASAVAREEVKLRQLGRGRGQRRSRSRGGTGRTALRPAVAKCKVLAVLHLAAALLLVVFRQKAAARRRDHVFVHRKGRDIEGVP